MYTVTVFFNAWYKYGLISMLFIHDARKYICNAELINLIRILVSARTQKHAYIGWGFIGTEGTRITHPGLLVLPLFQLCAITCLCTVRSAMGHVEKPDGLFPFAASFTERGQA